MPEKEKEPFNNLEAVPSNNQELEPNTMELVPREIRESSAYTRDEMMFMSNQLEKIKDMLHKDLQYKREFTPAEDQALNSRYWQIQNQPSAPNLSPTEKTKMIFDILKEKLEALPKPDLEPEEPGEIINRLSSLVSSFLDKYAANPAENNKTEKDKLLKAMKDARTPETSKAIDELSKMLEEYEQEIKNIK